MRRRLLLAVTCAGMFFALLDVTIVNVALPALRDDLGLGPSGLQWVVDADTVGFACGMLSAGTLGDATGRRRLLLIGLALVGVGSALCGLASGLALLLAGRAIQGVGGALLLPQSLAPLAEAHPEPGEQARAIGVWSGVSSLALPAGPLVGGLLVDRFGWPAVFWINVPVMALTLVVAARVVVETPRADVERRSAARRLDLPGQALVTAGIGLVVAGMVTAGGAGWGAPLVVALLLSGTAALVGFVAWERRAPRPTVPPDLVRQPGFVPGDPAGPGFVAGLHRAGLAAAAGWALAAVVATRAPARSRVERGAHGERRGPVRCGHGDRAARRGGRRHR